MLMWKGGGSSCAAASAMCSCFLALAALLWTLEALPWRREAEELARTKLCVACAPCALCSAARLHGVTAKLEA